MKMSIVSDCHHARVSPVGLLGRSREVASLGARWVGWTMRVLQFSEQLQVEVVEYKLIQDKMKLMDTSTVHVQGLILEAKPEVWRHPSIGKLPLRYHQLETRYSGPDCQKCLSAPSHKIV